MAFGNLMQNDMPITTIWSKLLPDAEFQYGGRLFLQNGNNYSSAENWVMATKFGLLIRDGPSEDSGVTQSEPGSKIAPQQPPSGKSI